jgi:hypothetical protein
MLRQKLYFAGDRLLSPDASSLFGDWCIADSDLALMLNRLVMNGDEVPARLASYAARQWERPSVQQWVELDRPPLRPQERQRFRAGRQPATSCRSSSAHRRPLTRDEPPFDWEEWYGERRPLVC